MSCGGDQEAVASAFSHGFLGGMQRIMHIRDPKHYDEAPDCAKALAAYLASLGSEMVDVTGRTDPVTAFIEHLASVSEQFAWGAGVGGCETAGAVVSYLAKHPEKLEAFQSGGFFEMCPEPGTDLHREGRLSWMSPDGKVWTAEMVAAAIAHKEASHVVAE